MWDKKDENHPSKSAEATPRPAAASSTGGSKIHNINIGQSIIVKGELSGSEDLTIDGRVEGKISLKDHDLVIGQHGRIDAEVLANRVTILGQVTGNVIASERVEIQPGGRLEGDITAPRIAIADGAHFRGKVDMDRSATTSDASPGDRPAKAVSGVAAGKIAG